MLKILTRMKELAIAREFLITNPLIGTRVGGINKNKIISSRLGKRSKIMLVVITPCQVSMRKKRHFIAESVELKGLFLICKRS